MINTHIFQTDLINYLIVKRTSTILTLFAVASNFLAGAQTTFEEVTSNLDKSGGVYYA